MIWFLRCASLREGLRSAITSSSYRAECFRTAGRQTTLSCHRNFKEVDNESPNTRHGQRQYAEASPVRRHIHMCPDETGGIALVEWAKSVPPEGGYARSR